MVLATTVATRQALKEVIKYSECGWFWLYLISEVGNVAVA
jgi:hypothetical protein